MFSADDVRTVLVVYSAVVSTVLLIWTVVRAWRGRTRLILGEPRYGAVKETSTEVPILSITLKNPGNFPIHVASISLVTPKNERIVLSEKAAVGPVTRSFEVAPMGQREFTVSGQELAQQLESRGLHETIRATLVVQDEMYNRFTRRNCKLSIDRLKAVTAPAKQETKPSAAQPPTTPLPV